MHDEKRKARRRAEQKQKTLAQGKRDKRKLKFVSALDMKIKMRKGAQYKMKRTRKTVLNKKQKA